MPSREDAAIPLPDSPEKKFSSKRFANERIDAEVLGKQEYKHFVFEFCTFEKIGAKGTAFIHCEFRHCEFIDCYLAHARFQHCSLLGSNFDRCVFSWTRFPNTGFDYTNFFNCGPVISQIIEHKPRDPQNAAKFLRNLASEHRRLGNWDQVDRFVIEAYRERERHFWYVITGENDHYRKTYGASDRLTYLARYIGYKMSGSIIGYGISWVTFLRTIFGFGVFIFPLLNSLLGRDSIRSFQMSSATGEEIRAYLGELYVVTTQSYMPFVPKFDEQTFGIVLPFWLSAIEASFGTAMIAVFAALLFRWASKGV